MMVFLSREGRALEKNVGADSSRKKKIHPMKWKTGISVTQE